MTAEPVIDSLARLAILANRAHIEPPGVADIVSRNESVAREGTPFEQQNRRGKTLAPPYTWRFRLFVLMAMATAAVGLFFLQSWLWPASDRLSPWQVEWRPVTYIWLLPTALGVLSVVGMLLQRPPSKTLTVSPHIVVFRYVSRGQNAETLRAAIHSVHDAMASRPLFPYLVEAVVEQPIGLHIGEAREVVVPPSYKTARGTLFKARGLQYALENTTASDSTWIFHCDEESHVTPSLVEGIARTVVEEETAGTHRIGQGCVLYHHTLRDNPILTLSDSIRTGDDVGRWHLQNRFLRKPLLGMHGSFILVRQSVERAVDFDDGPAGSITEDAWWALKATAAGYRTTWVDGFLIEQAPERVRDFVRQRRRWMTGLRLTARHAPARARLRLPLRVFLLVWALSPLALLLTLADVFLGIRANLAVQVIGDISYASYVTIYVVGLRMTLRDVKVGVVRTGQLYILQVLLMPFFSALESAGALWATVSPAHDFYVIQKHH